LDAGATAPQARCRRDVLRVDRARPRALRRAPRGEADGDRRLPDGIVDEMARAATRRTPRELVRSSAGESKAPRRTGPAGPGRPGGGRAEGAGTSGAVWDRTAATRSAPP